MPDTLEPEVLAAALHDCIVAAQLSGDRAYTYRYGVDGQLYEVRAWPNEAYTVTAVDATGDALEA